LNRQPKKLHLDVSCWSGASVHSLVLPLPWSESPGQSNGLIALQKFIRRSTILCNLLRVGKRIAANDAAFASFTSSNGSFQYELPHGQLRMFRRKARHQCVVYLVIEVRKSAGGRPDIIRVPIETVLQRSPNPSDPTGATAICADGSIVAFLRYAFDKLPNPAAEQPPRTVRANCQPRRVSTAAS
jgi:hypothetical protein